jgi:CheY-like chemotaxis protein
VVRGLRKHSMECPIVIAEDGMVGLQILRGTHTRKITKPFIVLLDLNMPRMNGLEFLREVRHDAALKGTVVFVLTTSGAQADLERAYEHSIAGYMVKSAVGPQFKNLARFLLEYRSIVLIS